MGIRNVVINLIAKMLLVVGALRGSTVGLGIPKLWLPYFSPAVLGAFLLLVSGFSYAFDEQHKIASGDTLWDISDFYYGSPEEWPTLQQLNAIADPYALQPGTMIDLSILDPFPLSVIYASGQTWLIEENHEIRLHKGDLIEAGSIIQTDAGSALSVQMRDGARAVIPSNSNVMLKRDGKNGVTFVLNHGEIESHVPKNRLPGKAYNIQTNMGVLGVRGTDFRAVYKGDALITSVYDGRVFVQSENGTDSSLVHVNQGARIDDSGSIQVVNILPAPEDISIVSHPRDGILIEILSPVGSHSYKVKIALDPHFLNLKHVEHSQDSRLALKPDSSGFYHLRISAIDELGVEGESSDFLIYHHVGVSVTQQGDEWLFEWPHLPRINYRLQLSNDDEFANILFDYELQSDGALKISRLPSAGLYWRVVTVDANEEITSVYDVGRLND